MKINQGFDAIAELNGFLQYMVGNAQIIILKNLSKKIGLVGIINHKNGNIFIAQVGILLSNDCSANPYQGQGVVSLQAVTMLMDIKN